VELGINLFHCKRTLVLDPGNRACLLSTLPQGVPALQNLGLSKESWTSGSVSQNSSSAHTCPPGAGVGSKALPMALPGPLQLPSPTIHSKARNRDGSLVGLQAEWHPVLAEGIKFNNLTSPTIRLEVQCLSSKHWP
jgi:hypothetical protein